MGLGCFVGSELAAGRWHSVVRGRRDLGRPGNWGDPRLVHDRSSDLGNRRPSVFYRWSCLRRPSKGAPAEPVRARTLTRIAHAFDRHGAGCCRVLGRFLPCESQWDHPATAVVIVRNPPGIDLITLHSGTAARALSGPLIPVGATINSKPRRTVTTAPAAVSLLR